jgi:hypothetical protein
MIGGVVITIGVTMIRRATTMIVDTAIGGAEGRHRGDR